MKTIAFAGEIRPEVDRGNIVANMAKRLHITTEQGQNIVDAGQPMNLKRGLNAEKAATYQNVLEGLGVAIEVIDDGAPLAPAPRSLARCPLRGRSRRRTRSKRGPTPEGGTQRRPSQQSGPPPRRRRPGPPKPAPQSPAFGRGCGAASRPRSPWLTARGSCRRAPGAQRRHCSPAASRAAAAVAGPPPPRRRRRRKRRPPQLPRPQPQRRGCGSALCCRRCRSRCARAPRVAGPAATARANMDQLADEAR